MTTKPDRTEKPVRKLRRSEAERVRLARELEAARREMIKHVALRRVAEKEIKRLKKESAEVKDELEQAHTCLEEYGDVDYHMMTQGGNQGLRHVDQALDVLKKEAEE